jgi:malate dehydrogenase (oxaloacetate-decarboxylating)
VALKVPVDSDYALALAYTPGVAEPCRAIHAHPETVYDYTCKGNTVAIVSDGSRVLGLGNIGPKAAIPVMEGKAALFKGFSGIDAFPICLDTQDPEQIIAIVKALSPIFGGINLEDIATPKCYEIEDRLIKELDIPVFHDDQHGTAIVAVAAVLGAMRLLGKDLKSAKVVINGAGAAGTAITSLFYEMGTGEITMVDRAGILNNGMSGLNERQAALAAATNPAGRSGSLADAVAGADVLFGASAAGAFSADLIRNMNKDAIVFALANPEPEISYADAKAAGARIAGTGRSDTPNQVNNVLVFPGLFRGALDVRANQINIQMKKAAARALAQVLSDDELRDDLIIPKPFDPRVVPAVAAAVAQAAKETGVARL